MTTPSAENLFAVLRQARLNLERAEQARDLAESTLNDRLDQHAIAQKAYHHALLDIEAAAKVAE